MRYVSFSLWGDNPKYLVGAVENVKLAKVIYPDWVCRFFLLQGEPQKYPALNDCVEDLLRLNAIVTMWPANDIPPMYLRFLLADDPDADYFMVRDCDSRLSLREKAAIDEWLASGKLLHTTRDHPAHCRGINGGCWAAKGGVLPNMERSIRDWCARLGRDFVYGDDQDFLGQAIWTKFYNHAMQHDSCCKYPGSVPFPTRREGYRFVGEVFEADGTPRAGDWEQVIPNQL